MNKRRGQMKLSFGMIFSIILIVIFMAFAFFAIKKFLEVQDTVKVGKFIKTLQEDVDKMWKGDQGAQTEEYSLPSKIKKICFADYSSPSKGVDRGIYGELEKIYYESQNLFFYPLNSVGTSDSTEIRNIDLAKTSESHNPFCVENVGGKVKMIIEKEYGEALVTITK